MAAFCGFQLSRDWSRELRQMFIGLTILGAAMGALGFALLWFARQQPKHVRLGSILRWKYRLTDEQIAEIAEKSVSERKRLGEMAVELGYITEGELAAALREQAQVNAPA